MRPLLTEGRLLFRYLLGAAPEPLLLKLYVRGLCNQGLTEPLPLPALVRRCPALLRLLDPVSGEPRGVRAAALAKRLTIALLIIDAMPRHSGRLYDYAGGGRLKALLRLGPILAVEALWLPARWLAERLEAR